jgi:hypothetical protein
MGFDDLTKKTETCWLWTGFRNRDGYGVYRGRLAHRVAYIAAYGPYPEGTVTDHLCRVRHCVNPQHLEAVTIGENIRRGQLSMLMKLKHRRIVACPKGHLYTQDNLYLDENRDGHTRRKCKICTKERRRLQYLRERETLRGTVSSSRETT